MCYRQTDRQTDKQTDSSGYRVAPQLKNNSLKEHNLNTFETYFKQNTIGLSIAFDLFFILAKKKN